MSSARIVACNLSEKQIILIIHCTLLPSLKNRLKRNCLFASITQDYVINSTRNTNYNRFCMGTV